MDSGCRNQEEWFAMDNKKECYYYILYIGILEEYITEIGWKSDVNTFNNKNYIKMKIRRSKEANNFLLPRNKYIL